MNFILISYTENGLQLEGTFNTHDAAYQALRELFAQYCEMYDGKDGEYDDGDSWINTNGAYSYGNEWSIMEIEV